MLHYSNASSIEKNRRYLVIKGGLAWLLWQEREGSSTPQSYWVTTASVSVSSGRRGGRNNKYNANRCITMHDKAKRDARRALTRYEVIPVKREHPGKYPQCFVFSGRGAGGGKLRV